MLKANGVLSCVLFAGVSFGISGNVAAQDVYAGVSVGQAEAKDFCEDLGSGCDDTATTGRLYGGGFLDEQLAFEGGYRYIDDVSASASVPGMSASVEASYHMFDGSLLAFTPKLGIFRLFAKAGVQFWQQDVDAAFTGLDNASESERGISFRTGLGIKADVNESFALRLEWDYLQNIGDNIGDFENSESDIHVFSAGPEFRF
ncbi:MAG: outer membrane beta-barrel protein [Marinobacter sp.]